MNRVCKNGKIYGYDVATGKLFDLNTYETIEEKKVKNEKLETWDEFKENIAKTKTKAK